MRGKTLIASEAIASLESGCSITTTMLAKDTSHRTVFPVFTSGGGFGMKEMEGAADVLDGRRPHHVPRAAMGAGHGLGAVRSLFQTAGRCRSRPAASIASVLDELGGRGYDFVAGLEVEFHLFKLEDAQDARRRMPASPARRRRSACSPTAINT